MKIALPAASAAILLASAPQAVAQDVGEDPFEGTVFDGDYLSIGVGAAYVPSYSGSDDYVISPLPIVQASISGIEINPRAGGVSVDFLPDPESGPGFDLGIAGRLRASRSSQIKDPVVESLGKLDKAIELGPTAGISFPGVLNPYDSLTISVDALWDVAGAHDGMVTSPSISYFTPLSQGIAASLSVSAEYADGDFHDYYFAVTPADSVTTGGVLPVFDPSGGGFTDIGANLLVGIDLNGNLADGGLALVLVGGYSRMLGDAKRSPFTSVRGSADQWVGAIGIGYTF